MVNSSPEYAMYAGPIAHMTMACANDNRTKPGVHHLKKRDKPLKTYGKRQSPPTESPVEPPKKRVRWAENLTSDEPDTTPSRPRKSSIREESLSPNREDTIESKVEEQEPVTEQPVAKESILNYFKRVAPPKETRTVSKSTDNNNDLDGTRPESPQQRPRKIRRKRLLRIRSNHSPRIEKESDDEDCDSPGLDDRSTPLSEGGEALHNQQRGTLSNEKAKRQKVRLAPQVQTTLNLSSQAAFSECKICDTVWNPLYPDDVKYHTKRHAAHLRGKKRAIEELEL